jgi:tetratricopeptide (TPR) repeat protein
MLDEIQIELKNLKKAWKLIIELKQTEKLEVFIETLYQFFNIRSRYQEGIELFQLAIIFMNQLQVEKAIDHYEILEGKVLVRIGSLAHRVRENGLARKSLEKAKLIFSKHSLDKELTDCQAALAEVYLRSNEYAAAEQTGHKILGFYQKSNDMIGQIKALNTLGLVSLRRGDIEVARRYLHQSVALGRKSENQRQLIVPLNYLGDIACNEGDYSEATYLFEESLKIASELEDLYQVALLLNNLASVYHVELDYPKAIEMYRKSLEICRQIGDLNGEAIALANLGEVALAQENYSGAITLSNQALSISREIGEEWSVSICLNNLAEAYCKIGQIDKAMRQIKEAIQIAYKNEATRFLARFMVTAGRCYQLQGMLDQAKDLLFAALGYSGIEFDIREKAIVSCKEMEIEELPEEDDEKLADVVRRYFGIEN